VRPPEHLILRRRQPSQARDVRAWREAVMLLLLLPLLVRVVPELEGVDMANMINVKKKERRPESDQGRSFSPGFI